MSGEEQFMLMFRHFPVFLPRRVLRSKLRARVSPQRETNQRLCGLGGDPSQWKRLPGKGH